MPGSFRGPLARLESHEPGGLKAGESPDQGADGSPSARPPGLLSPTRANGKGLTHTSGARLPGQAQSTPTPSMATPDSRGLGGLMGVAGFSWEDGPQLDSGKGLPRPWSRLKAAGGGDSGFWLPECGQDRPVLPGAQPPGPGRFSPLWEGS